MQNRYLEGELFTEIQMRHDHKGSSHNPKSVNGRLIKITILKRKGEKGLV